MENLIINKLKIEGEFHEIMRLLEKYTTAYPNTPLMEGEGLIVYTDNYNVSSPIGHYNTQTKLFQIEGQFVERTKIPDNYRLVLTFGHQVFPDFEQIIPTPEDLHRYVDSSNSIEVLVNQWRKENWGVEEQSRYHDLQKHHTCIFITDDYGVPKIIEKMSQEFPELKFLYQYAGGDKPGTCCAKYEMIDGIIEFEIYEDNSDEAVLLSKMLIKEFNLPEPLPF